MLSRKEQTRARVGAGLISFLFIGLLIWAGPVLSAQETTLDVLDVQFDPLQQGKNIVKAHIRNTSGRDQMFRIHIYTRSPEYGRRGVGWGTGFFKIIPAGQTRWTRSAFKIQGPLTDSTYVRLTFSNPGAAERFDEEVWTQSQGWKQSFQKTTYPALDLKWRQENLEEAQAAPADLADVVIGVLQRVQQYIQEGEYDQAWSLFTRDYQQAEFQSTDMERFVKIMEPQRPIDAAFLWEKERFLSLKPAHAVQKGQRLSLAADSDGQTWTIDFVRESGQWKVDWIAGYTPRVFQWQNWEEHVLPKMVKYRTPHFNICYSANSTAARQIEQLEREKEKGYKEICDFLGADPDARIRLVLFEDKETKHWETGHQGMGWAYDNTIVEVYNEAEKLDPYHETVHILMGPLGSPPALFTEGFAVYMSERLGAHALEDLSGGTATIDQRTKALKADGQWIALQELISYVEIGSLESRPPVAYAEAASFVKFLIDEYGKEKFLRAYRTLANTNNAAVQQRNIEALTDIYGATLAQLDQRWQQGIQHGDF